MEQLPSIDAEYENQNPQGGASVPAREAAVRVLQGSVQSAEEKTHEVLLAVRECKPLDVFACRKAKRVLCGIGEKSVHFWVGWL